jgi:hypothetical protein
LGFEKGTAMTTAYHAKYFAHDLTRRATEGVDRLSSALFDASVDLNPHQIEAAVFALQSPLSKGVILADEVGLGKTIEAGIVLCQYWAERRRRLLVITPASIRKQWALELREKFNLPAVVLDAKSYREAQKAGRNPLRPDAVLVCSYYFANRLRDDIRGIAWDLIVIDEAHKLRNSYRPSSKVGQGIRFATADCRKLLLTATPLQNSLLELYGLSTLIDDHIFGDVNSFRAQYTSAGGDLAGLRNRLAPFCKRTLRNQVTEYIRYTDRRPITQPFRPSDDEHALYEAVSEFLQRESSYALPQRQRHLMALILRKLLASSSQAIAGTLNTLRERLETLHDERIKDDPDFTERLVEDEDIEADLLDEILTDDEDDEEKVCDELQKIDRAKLRDEIDTLGRLADWARRIGVDSKSQTLLTALEIGFKEMAAIGAAKKALIFTESRRTQDYLKAYLEANGYRGKIVVFNGTNGGPEATAIYDRWVARHAGTDRVSGSREVDLRTALVEHFRDDATIMLATEAAAEGVNMQFCSLVVNYDLPWNPQRVEQRIGRCHRYGQQHDVVVINFLNERNEADKRVLELLTEKFSLFRGVFDASDDVLGPVDSDIDFESRILFIYQSCRTTAEIDAAFTKLQAELDEQIQARLADTQKQLLEHFAGDVHERLRLRLADARAQLDRVGQRFWVLTRFMLAEKAAFDDEALSFDLTTAPRTAIPTGRYHLISKSAPQVDGTPSDDGDGILYRLSHPLGEHVLSKGKTIETPPAAVTFDVSRHAVREPLIEWLRGKSGYLRLSRLAISSYEREEHLLFSAFDDEGVAIDQETCEKLFLCAGTKGTAAKIPATAAERLTADSTRHAEATISQSLEANSKHFHEAREKLDRWAEDMVRGAEEALEDTKEQIKVCRRQARQATTLEQQHEIQDKIRKLEKQQRRQRQEVFQVEDEIMEKRDNLIDDLERRLAQTTESEPLFTIRWIVT